MLKKKLTPVPLTSKEFKQVLSTGNYVRKREGIYKFLRGQNVKYGIAVSKKAGNAVARNLVKRRLRTILKSKLKENENLWIAIIVYNRMGNYAAINTAVTEVLNIIHNKKNEKNNYTLN